MDIENNNLENFSTLLYSTIELSDRNTLIVDIIRDIPSVSLSNDEWAELSIYVKSFKKGIKNNHYHKDLVEVYELFKDTDEKLYLVSLLNEDGLSLHSTVHDIFNPVNFDDEIALDWFFKKYYKELYDYSETNLMRAVSAFFHKEMHDSNIIIENMDNYLRFNIGCDSIEILAYNWYLFSSFDVMKYDNEIKNSLVNFITHIYAIKHNLIRE